MEKVRKWKEEMEKKGLRVNAGKTKIMWCRLSMGQAEDSGEHPCGVYSFQFQFQFQFNLTPKSV